MEELPDTLGYLGTNFFGLLQRLFIRLRDGVQASKRFGQYLCGPLAHEWNAQPVQDAREAAQITDWSRARSLAKKAQVLSEELASSL